MHEDRYKFFIEKYTIVILCMLYILHACSAFPQIIDPYNLTPHAAVIRNAQMEAKLPIHLRNPFYQNPKVARALAYSSRLGPGELPVHIREAERIPRGEIYKMLVHAGFIPRRRSLNSLQYF